MTMLMRQMLQKKAAILKQYELYAYQAAYFLLENEELAMHAAKQALMAVIQEVSFFDEHPDQQQKRMKQAVMKHALKTKAANLQPAF